MNETRIEGDKIVLEDGTEMEVPQSPGESTKFLNEETGRGYVAIYPTPDQLQSFYEASAKARPLIEFGARTYYLDSDESRYSSQWLTDPADSLPTDPKGQISEVRQFYQLDPLLGGIVDVLSELTSSPLKLQGGSQEGRDLFHAWMEDADIEELDRMMAREYWLSGNVFVSRVLTPLTPSLKNSINDYFRKRKESIEKEKGGRAKRFFGRLRGQKLSDRHEEVERWIEESLSARKNRWTKVQIPFSYAVLDPLTVELDGNLNGDPVPKIKIDDDTRKQILEAKYLLDRGDPSDWEDLVFIYGEDFLIDALDPNNKFGRIPAERFRCYFYSRPSYQKISHPPAGRALPWLQYKMRLRDVALNIVSNAVAFIVLIKIGSDKFPATPEHLDNAEAAWKERPRKKSAAIWFQPHTTSIEVITPSEESYNLLREDLFVQANNEISQSFGINFSLFTGVSSAGNVGYSTSTIALRPTIARIRMAQRKSENLIYKEMLEIAGLIGMPKSEVPRPQHSATGLENYAEVATALTNALDRGVISYKTYLERAFNIPFYEEVDQVEWERENDMDLVFQMRGSPTQIPGRPPGDLDPPSTNPDGNLHKPPEENRLG